MSNDLKERVVEYLKSVDKVKSKDIAKALGEKKKDVDTVVKELAKAGKVEFLYIGTSYVKWIQE